MKAVVIGAGMGGLSVAGYLAQAGFQVTILEKNEWVGGRVREWKHNGYRFDMGPSWYWMTDHHDQWFKDLGFKREDYYSQQRVDPSYKVVFKDCSITLPVDVRGIMHVFDSIEPGSGGRLKQFLYEMGRDYAYLMKHVIYYHPRSVLQWARAGLMVMRYFGIKGLVRNYHQRIARIVKDSRLRKILLFPVVFLGGNPKNIPAAYAIMNYIDMELGTWYPEGGFSRVPEAMAKVVKALGAKIECKAEVHAIECSSSKARFVHTKDRSYEADLVVCNADRYLVDQFLIPEHKREYSPKAWNRKAIAPGVFNLFLGVADELPELCHHTFYFDADWDRHFHSIYARKRWPEEPLFYIHAAQKSDASAAPKGKTGLFCLVPIASGIRDTNAQRLKLLAHVLRRLEHNLDTNIREKIEFERVVSLNEFEQDFNAYKGNAFGLSMTLKHTFIFRDFNRSRTIPNMYFSGQYTSPGTGTTMSMISGKVVAGRIIDELSL